jgi:chromate transporter
MCYHGEGKSSVGESQRNVPLRRLARIFGWLGLIGFGGGPAVLSLMREYVVEREKWLDDEGFVEAVALGQSLPGVIGTNTATYIGLRLRGWLGAIIAITSFIFPSFVIIVVLAAIYMQTRHVPAVEHVFFGLNPAMAGIIAATAFRLGHSTVKTWWHFLLAAAACTIVTLYRFLVVHVILAAGLVGILVNRLIRHQQVKVESGSASKHTEKLRLSVLPILLWVGAALSVGELMKVLLVFLKIGALTYGGGYVMVPLMEHDVVRRFRWVNSQQFADGVALGQLTPGPVAITCTFVGYFAAGLAGATVATIAIFLPSFLMTGIAGTYLNRFRENRWIQAALDGIAPTVSGLLLTGAIIIAQTSVHSILAGVIAVASGLLLGVARLSPLYILLGAGAAGLLLN